ncbi:Ger(x)C family spore germination protein [Oceanobacillus jordanicus]|uniref:Ger(X)C family spore germination protein n=1 Tax=Oceanobacillus jordanicus TaxID=2867266 RepID=A0AAW5BEU0_9BACI|nr:Ger(x)C family spore germination protein [Oceanobacillus jordanicus]MCG3421137.1 Ger(x)C family spore germination protein [Oceanobacillus jordanicus]
MQLNKKVLVFLISSTIFLAGCWDRVDIEERGFIVGTAIDLVNQEKENEYEVMMTNQFVIPSGIGTLMQGGGGQAFMNVSEKGTSVFRTNRKFSRINSQEPFYQHLKVLVVSEEVLIQPHLFSNMMDFFIRDHALRRSIRLLVAHEDAKEILNSTPENTDVPAMYLDDLMENVDRNTNTIKPIHIGEIQELILNQQSYVLPVVRKVGSMAEYGNVVVMDGESNQMVGSLNEDETSGLGFINGHTEGGVLEVQVDESPLAVEITKINQKMKITNTQKNNVEVEISILIDGNIAEYFGVESVLDEKFLEKAEASTEKKVKELTAKTIKKVQQELNTDVLGVSKNLYQFHYDFWQEVKEDWENGENYFSSADIKINSEVKIDRVGSADRIKMKEE